MQSLDPSFNPLDSSSSIQLLWDSDNDGNDDDNDNDGDNADDDDLINVDDNNNLMRLQNFDLNDIDIEGMSEYEVLRLWRIRRNEAKLASLGLLAPMTSVASLSSDRSNSKKCSASQDDVERRVQPKRNAKQPTSYRDLDDHVIYKRTRPIDSSDMGEKDIVRKRMHEDEVEYSPSGGDDEEEDNEAELESYDDDDNDDDDECTNDSDLQSDDDGDEASKKWSFKKIANTEPDLLHLIADLGHHCEVNCTVRFSNSDSIGDHTS